MAESKTVFGLTRADVKRLAEEGEKLSAAGIVSIRDKLVAQASRMVLGTMLTLLALGALIGFLGYQSKVRDLRESIRTGLIDKGKLLVANNSLALRGLAADNAFLAVRELVSSALREDRDITYGIFMDAQRRPWVMASRVNPGGEVSVGRALDDSLALWASASMEAGYWQVAEGRNGLIEFAAPVQAEGQRLGTIRYGVSTARMEHAIALTQRGALVNSLAYPAFFALVGFLFYFVQSRAARRQAEAITRPLNELTAAASAIAAGNYGVRITTETNDEVGVLARNFEAMRERIEQYTNNLEQMVAERTEQLQAAQRELVEKAHRAGMADIATGTLHNVGNILNSVKTSSDIIADIVAHSTVESLGKANALLRQNMDHLEDFVAADPRGPKLMQYYLKLQDAFSDEHEQLRAAASRLSEKVNAIIEVIAAQQSYAGVSGLVEEASLAPIVEDALTMQSGSIERYQISVVRDYNAAVPPVPVQRTKLVHVLINLIKNAKEAMCGTPVERRVLTVRIDADSAAAYIMLRDNGCGIKPQDLTRIFGHGFTTKKDGHGFGLHSSANYMKEMGGSLRVESAGEGTGATFILSFPLTHGAGQAGGSKGPA